MSPEFAPEQREGQKNFDGWLADELNKNPDAYELPVPSYITELPNGMRRNTGDKPWVICKFGDRWYVKGVDKEIRNGRTAKENQDMDRLRNRRR